MGGRPRRCAALACGLAATLAPAAAAQERTVAAGDPVERVCHARLVPAGSAGAARTSFRPAATGVLTARLDGSRGDWDLALFDARSGRLLNAGAGLGPDERVTAIAAAGRQVLAQACRRTGGGRTARIGFDLYEQDAPAGPAEPAQLVRVPLDAVRTLERLEATGLDVTHDTGPDGATVVVYSAGERARLVAAGFAPTTLIPDMRAEERRRMRTDARYAKLTAASALPSGRDSYRTLAEYGADLKAIVDRFPAIARLIEIGQSLEGRPIEGVELGTDVRGRDGRPVFAVLGLHHAREWPSGEMPMEFALNLAEGHGRNARITELLDRVRVVALPVMNPDGFDVSRTAGPTPFDDNNIATLPLAVSDGASYKRKNCRPAAGSEDVPCISRPAAQGVDLNRNYGAYWGGVGSSDNPGVQNYRGTAPYSEPEAEAFHKLSSTRTIVNVVTHHTFTADGIWLRQPGFCPAPGPCSRTLDIVPDEAGMKALGDAMGEATGWDSDLGWVIGEITGATEDWNYFTQGAYGYTPEQRGPNFHPNYASSVVAEYLGTAPGAVGGVREALLDAGELAANSSFHSLLLGSAPPGRVLRLRKAFATDTSLPDVKVQDKLDFTTTVPDSGFYRWHVNQSTRPLSAITEAYTLTCETAAGAVQDTHTIVIGRGDTIATDLPCGQQDAPSSQPVLLPPGTPGGSGSPTAPLAPGSPVPPVAAAAACSDVRAPLSSPTHGSLRFRATRVKLRGRARDFGCRAARGLVERRGALARVLVAVARVERGRCAFLGTSGTLGKRRRCGNPAYLPAKGLASWSFRAAGQLPPGDYQVWSRAVDAAGNTESRRRRILTVTLR